MSDPPWMVLFLTFIVHIANTIGEQLDIQAFVKGDKLHQFPGLNIKYMRGADPELVLLDDNKQVAETLSIDKWNTDTIIEYLLRQLKQ